MTDNYRIAELIVACWKLGGESARIPTSHGILDRALKEVADSGGFPEWVYKHLHFVDSRIGLQCVELPSILEWAQRAQLTTAPNPSYETTEIQVSDRVARRLLEGLELDEPSASVLGSELRRCVIKAKEDLVGFDHATIEDY